MYTLIKILLAFKELYKSVFMRNTSLLYMTLLVKNEEALLEQNILFHKKMGVDGFIITDNNSTDNTVNIIKKYYDKGWIKEIINESGIDYDQKKWVDRMIWIAKSKYNADWVINADADELWYSPLLNIKKHLSIPFRNVLKCSVKSVYPEENKPFFEWNKVINPIENPDRYNLSKYSIFESQNKKVIHKTAGYLQISMGNHKVSMLPNLSDNCNILVYHYNVRDKQSFMTKMINGGKQLEQHKGRHGGRHWRYFYSLYKNDLLDDEYDKVIGKNCLDELMNDGYVIIDNNIKTFFIENINKK